MFVTSKQLGQIPREDPPKTNHKEVSMRTWNFIGLDIHKKVIAYCVRTVDGRLFEAGKIEASRRSRDE
jgi:hypothetical protein